jgi:hypothetical protein
MKVRMRRIELGSLFCALVLGSALTLSSGCGSGGTSCPPGSANCACFSNGTCNTGLTCSATATCVSSPGGPGSTCLSTIPAACAGGGNDPCSICLGQCCCTELVACQTSVSCANIAGCAISCSTTSCENACVSTYPAGESNWSDYLTCAVMNCTTECQ